MTHFVYKIINKVNGKEYIGVHSGNIDDGYLGSGHLLLVAIKKYGKANFERTILKKFKTRDKAIDYETSLLTEIYVSNSNNYNLAHGNVRLRYAKKSLTKAPKIAYSDKYIYIFKPNKGNIDKWEYEVSNKNIHEINKKETQVYISNFDRYCNIITAWYNDKRCNDLAKEVLIFLANKNYLDLIEPFAIHRESSEIKRAKFIFN